ncbi:LAFE_0E01904g1_1 [Lachancea fermentati]|uniref:LAFE_0E01904g1_1 n=1 Tax=Lachancea fermentati TaxID=4955 RepID=A0A1G4MCN5_LACFM|nr:LAFE_0E01904g1_1 [Lachancea fermentati]
MRKRRNIGSQEMGSNEIHRRRETQGTLPRDLYCCRFAWELSKVRFLVTTFLLSASLLVLLTWWSFHVSIDYLKIIFTLSAIFGIPLGFIVMMIIIAERDASVLSMKNRMHFLNQVIENRAGVTMDKWDLIAANMNRILISSGSCSDAGYFFNGEMCYDKFRRLFMPESKKTKYVELDPYIDKALRIYKANVSAYWSENIEGALDREFNGQ